MNRETTWKHIITFVKLALQRPEGRAPKMGRGIYAASALQAMGLHFSKSAPICF
jgi:hypothetical protein